MECRDFTENISVFMDHEMSEKQYNECRVHLDICPECRETLAQYELTGRLLRALPEQPVPEGLNAAVKRAIAEERKRTAAKRLKNKWYTYAACAAGLLIVLGAVPLIASTMRVGSAEKGDVMTEKIMMTADNQQAPAEPTAEPEAILYSIDYRGPEAAAAPQADMPAPAVKETVLQVHDIQSARNAVSELIEKYQGFYSYDGDEALFSVQMTAANAEAFEQELAALAALPQAPKEASAQETKAAELNQPGSPAGMQDELGEELADDAAQSVMLIIYLQLAE